MPRYETLQGFYWSTESQRWHLSFARLRTRFQVAAGNFQITWSRQSYGTQINLRAPHRRIYWRHLYIGWTTRLKGRHRA